MPTAIAGLSRRLGRHAFLPLAFRLSLALEQLDWDEVTEDPGVAVFAVRNGRRALKADGAVNWFDVWLEAEAAGAQLERDQLGRPGSAGVKPPARVDPESVSRSAPVTVATEVARRLVAEAGPQVAVLGYMTGGWTLLRTVFGAERRRRLSEALGHDRLDAEDREALETAVQVSVRLARAYCEARVDALLLAEADPLETRRYLPLFAPVANMAGYYGIPVVLVGRHPVTAEFADAARASGVTHVMAPGARDDGTLRPMPHDVLEDSNGSAVAWARREHDDAPGPRLFVSTWDVAPEAGADRLLATQAILAAGQT